MKLKLAEMIQINKLSTNDYLYQLREIQMIIRESS